MDKYQSYIGAPYIHLYDKIEKQLNLQTHYE